MSTLNASRLRSRVVIAAAATGATALAASYVQRLQRNADARPPVARIQLPPTVVEAIAGAMGEVSQIIALYPLDTIKVRCQSMGQSSGEVVKGLLAQGVNRRLLRKLYAGAWGAALCSILVGAVHFASFETSRRLLLQHLPAATAPAQQPAGVAGTATGAAAAAMQPLASSSSSSSPQHASACSSAPGSTLGSAESRLAAGEPSTSSSSSTSSASASASPQRQASDRWLINMLAATFAALATAVVESPVELFRHNQQAGLVKGDFVREMVSVVRRQGPAGLYWGFLPHCFEAWPHDISELWVYGSMKDLAHDASHSGSPEHTWLTNIPSHAWDLSTGAAAGAAAVMISMPFDCVKTYLQTHGTDLAGHGMRGSAALFVRTGADMVRRGGMGALYYGVVPRLLQQVPASTVGWYVIHTVQRLLEPYTAPTAVAVGTAPGLPPQAPPAATITPLTAGPTACITSAAAGGAGSKQVQAGGKKEKTVPVSAGAKTECRTGMGTCSSGERGGTGGVNR